MKNDPAETRPGRLLAIGDIHGCRNRLSALLEKVAPTPKDQVVFLGDYVDRGPDSAGVIDDLIELGSLFPATVFLCGNHEQMFLDYLADQNSTLFLFNGGSKTIDSYQRRNQWPPPKSHLAFLVTLQSYHETSDFIFVHAGLKPGKALSDQRREDLLWIRHEFIQSDYEWGKTVVYGHTPLDKPYLTDNRMGLDTGCVYGRQLTCCDVLTRTIWQA